MNASLLDCNGTQGSHGEVSTVAVKLPIFWLVMNRASVHEREIKLGTSKYCFGYYQVS